MFDTLDVIYDRQTKPVSPMRAIVWTLIIGIMIGMYWGMILMSAVHGKQPQDGWFLALLSPVALSVLMAMNLYQVIRGVRRYMRDLTPR